MRAIDFFKMSGSGNDFIVVDNRKAVVDEADLQAFIAQVCRRKMSVGADGFILIEDTSGADFAWRFFNSDGSVAEMCGNGARCAARFAYLNAIAGASMTFKTLAGIVKAEVIGDRVKIKVPDPFDLQTDYPLELPEGMVNISSINTGVPHVVIRVDDLEQAAVFTMGRTIRYHRHFAPAGTNVNFIAAAADGSIAIRTYERGVEDETLACGTGSIAAALVVAAQQPLASPARVLTRSGEPLNIYFNQHEGRFSDVHLEGDARIIYQGRLWDQAWQ